MTLDPRSLLTEVRHIVALADREQRDLTLPECERCDCLLDAAESLSKVQKMDADAPTRYLSPDTLNRPHNHRNSDVEVVWQMASDGDA